MLRIIKESVFAFIDDEALTRGAAIAFYTVTSIGPVLFIVVAIAGVAFGEDAARADVVDELQPREAGLLVGPERRLQGAWLLRALDFVDARELLEELARARGREVPRRRPGSAGAAPDRALDSNYGQPLCLQTAGGVVA